MALPLPEGIEVYWATSDGLPPTDMFRLLSDDPAAWFKRGAQDEYGAHCTKWKSYRDGLVEDPLLQVHYYTLHASGKVYVG